MAGAHELPPLLQRKNSLQKFAIKYTEGFIDSRRVWV